MRYYTRRWSLSLISHFDESIYVSDNFNICSARYCDALVGFRLGFLLFLAQIPLIRTRATNNDDASKKYFHLLCVISSNRFENVATSSWGEETVKREKFIFCVHICRHRVEMKTKREKKLSELISSILNRCNVVNFMSWGIFCRVKIARSSS